MSDNPYDVRNQRSPYAYAIEDKRGLWAKVWKQTAKSYRMRFLVMVDTLKLSNYTNDMAKECYEMSQEENARLRGLLRRYRELLVWVMGSHKGSIGSIDNVYLPQLDRDQIDAMYDELAKELADE